MLHMSFMFILQYTSSANRFCDDNHADFYSHFLHKHGRNPEVYSFTVNLKLWIKEVARI